MVHVRDNSIKVRLTPAEKRAFRAAADIEGESLSTAIRVALRRWATETLAKAGRRAAFLAPLEKEPGE